MNEDNANPNRPRLLPGGVPRSREPLTWKQAGPSRMAEDQDPVSVINRIGENVAYSARESGLPGTHNGPADALRHSMAMAELTRRYGGHLARGLGVVNEASGAFKAIAKGELPAWRETLMDLANNERGITAAKQPVPLQKVWEHLWAEGDKARIPSTNAESLRDALAGRMVILPPGEAKGSTLDEYVKAFNADTAVASPMPKPLKVANVEWQPPKPIEPVELNNDHAERYLEQLRLAKLKARAKAGGG